MAASEIAPDARILVAGHRGMVRSAIVRRLAERGYSQALTRSRAELGLGNHPPAKPGAFMM